MKRVRVCTLALAFFSLCDMLAWAQSQVKLAYECTEADADEFGLSCSEQQPCAVYLELSSVTGQGSTIFAAGNLHTSDRTLYSVLLMSEDRGLTWTEPHTRIKASALEQIEFADLQTGWISGESIDPLPRNPFFLLTTDGGRSWKQKLIFDDTKVGTVAQFHFTSRTAGHFILDSSRGKTIRQELYESNTGGESWETKQTSNTALRLPVPRPVPTLGWRARADARSGMYLIERGGGRAWEAVASFVIHIADCK